MSSKLKYSDAYFKTKIQLIFCQKKKKKQRFNLKNV